MKTSIRILIFTILILSGLAYYYWDLGTYLSLSYLKSTHGQMLMIVDQQFITASLIYFIIYVVTATLSLPGAAVLTLAGGALFGIVNGTILVSIASTIGATFAFLFSRYLFREHVKSKFKTQYEKVNAEVERQGGFYLFSLRLIPAFPFFIVNLLLGLTKMRVGLYFIISQIGMLPGTIVYVNAGTHLGAIEAMTDIVKPQILFSFVLLGVFPFIAKSFVNIYLKNRKLWSFMKPKKFDYNVVVIGAGSAGLVTSYIASAVKAKVALIERHKMGGDCLNTGCVPSKALIKSATIAKEISKSKDFGVEVEGIKVNFKAVMSRVHDVISEVAPHDSVERYTSLGVECIKGDAQIISPYEVKVGGRTLLTKSIVVATGASPFVPKIEGIEKISYLTSDSIWGLKELPKRFLVLGGGPIGCELAQSFSRLGSKVTIVEMSERLMGREDQDVSKFVEQVFAHDGLDVKTSHKALRFIIREGVPHLVCEFKGQEIEIPFDQVLIALGRRANTTGFGAENIGLEISKRGTFVADEYLRSTNYPNIYFCGDVVGPYQFTHTAAHQAWYASVNALFAPFKKFKVDYRVIPWCTFVDPEVARVGINELEAKELGVDYRVTRYEISDLDRAIADGSAHGFIKVITPKKGGKILGVTIVGKHAGDIIAEYVLAMKKGLGLSDILSNIHIYPTMAEANKYVAGVWKRETAPTKILALLEKFHTWRRNQK